MYSFKFLEEYTLSKLCQDRFVTSYPSSRVVFTCYLVKLTLFTTKELGNMIFTSHERNIATPQIYIYIYIYITSQIICDKSNLWKLLHSRLYVAIHDISYAAYDLISAVFSSSELLVSISKSHQSRYSKDTYLTILLTSEHIYVFLYLFKMKTDNILKYCT